MSHVGHTCVNRLRTKLNPPSNKTLAFNDNYMKTWKPIFVYSSKEPKICDNIAKKKKLTHSQVSCWSQVRTKSLKLRNWGRLGARSQLLALKGVEGPTEASRLDYE